MPAKIVSIVEAVEVSGLAKPALLFAEEARKRGVEVAILNFVRRGNVDTPFIQAAKAAAVPVELIHERMAFDLGIVSSLRDNIDRLKPDVILTHAVKSHFLARAIGLNKNARWVAFHHGYTTTNRTVLAYNQLNRWSLPAADRVVTVCRAFIQELVNSGVPTDRISVQHSCVRPFIHPGMEAVSALRSKLGISSNEKIVLSVGRLSSEKGHIDLIEAFSRIKPGSHLVIAGDGPTRQLLERRAVELTISSRVHLIGQVQDVAPLYAAADLFVLPSYSEGSPNVILEAMAAGVPVVATRVGGVPEILESGLVPAHDVAALADEINRALEDDRRRQAGDISSRFDPATYCQGILSVLAAE